MAYTAEEPAATENQISAAPRPRKGTLLPQIAPLALAGQSCRQIAATFGLRKSTVHRWLQDLREGCPTRPANCAQMVATAVADYESLYHEALDAFHLSQADKEVCHVVETKTARGSKTKRTTRTESQAGKPAFLAAARRALDGIARLASRIAPRPGRGEEREKGGRREREKRRALCTRGRVEKKREEYDSVPLPQGGPVRLNDLPEGELGGICGAEGCVIAAECPIGTVPLTNATQAPQSQPVVNAHDQVTPSLPEESRLPERRTANSANGAKPAIDAIMLSAVKRDRSPKRKRGRWKEHGKRNPRRHASGCPVGLRWPAPKRIKFARGQYTARTSAVQQRGAMGQATTTRLDAELCASERQPSLFARISDWHTLPVLEMKSTIRSKTRRQKLANGFKCPIPSAATGARSVYPCGHRKREKTKR